MIGFFDLRNGCAGDMICAALAGCVDTAEIGRQLKKVDFPTKYEIEIKKVIRAAEFFHGLKANQFIVHVNGKEDERSYSDIVSIFKRSKLPERISNKIIHVFNILADAESKIHEKNLNDLHFHAVGQTDALVEVSFSILALEYLGIKKIIATPVGISGAAPATMEMIFGIPVIIRNIPLEITTPTGMAIIKAIIQSFDDSPELIVEGYSYGAGTLNAGFPDTLQFIYGREFMILKDRVCVIETSLDDINPVIFEHLIEKLYKSGALEVSYFTGFTKKSRPLFWIRILCPPLVKSVIIELLFKESTTLGIRYREEERIILKRSVKKVRTIYGDIEVKFGYFSGEIVNVMPEYESCKKIANEKKIPVKNVIEETIKAALGLRNKIGYNN